MSKAPRTARNSVKAVANRAKAQDAADRKAWATVDSFQNFAAKTGIGTDNIMSQSTYGFNPITRQRSLLEWMHRGSWLAGVAIDVVPDDMTRAGIDFMGTLDPAKGEELQQELTTSGVWDSLNDALKWGRLYGGCLAVPLIDGQDFSTQLRPDRVGKGQFKGLAVLDRWMVDPSLNDLVHDMGPSMGKPKFYTAISDAAIMSQTKIHYTRTVRCGGVKLPYWQAVQENLWDESILERIYDRMVAFDSATTGAAQLVYKAHLRTYKLKDFRDAIVSGGEAVKGVIAQLAFMARTQANEGTTILDAEDDFEAHQYSFAGLSDIIEQFGGQIAGALQVPVVRLFGQSPGGMNSSGDSELRTYYDGIKQQQEKTLRTPLMTIIQIAARSRGITLSKNFNFEFRALWQLTEEAKAKIAESTMKTITAAMADAVMDRATGMKELRQSSVITGIGTNITDEAIKEAEADPAPLIGTDMLEYQAEQGKEGAEHAAELSVETAKAMPDKAKPGAAKKSAAKKKAKAGDERFLGSERDYLGLPLVIEARKGEYRYGYLQPADYGNIRYTGSAEGKDENMDCFVGPHDGMEPVYIVDGYWPDGAFDEHKVMLGYRTPFAALADYYKAYGDREARDIHVVDIAGLKSWLASGDVSKPYAAQG